jgi:hypothetical protein
MRTALRTVAALFVATIVPALGATAAQASPQFESQFQMGYLSAEPGASTGLSTVMTWSDPGAPGGAPKAIKKIDLRFEPGTRFDTNALPQCHASDIEVLLLGASACPPASVLGGGSTIGIFSIGLQFDTVVTLFNAPDQIIVFVTVGGLPATEFRDDVKSDEIVVNPALPPTVSLKRLALQVNPHTSATGTAYMRAPPTCPPSGRWTIAATFTYDDASSDAHTSGSACDRGIAEVTGQRAAALKKCKKKKRGKARKRCRKRAKKLPL